MRKKRERQAPETEAGTSVPEATPILTPHRPPINEPLPTEKEVAYYSAMIQAWVDTRMELDRTLVALSAGGLGLLATLLMTVGVERAWHLAFFGLSALGFLGALIMELVIFKRNSAFIEETIGVRKGKTTLANLDKLVLLFFGIGAAALLTIGGLSAVTPKGEPSMPQKEESGRSAAHRTQDEPLKKSLDGIQNLMPKEPAPSSSPAPTSSSDPSLTPATPSTKK